MRSAARGMTLLEIMVVVVIISLIGVVTATAVMTSARKAKVRLAGTQVRNVADAVGRFWADENRYPNRLDELVPEYIETDQLVDPWGNPLQFQKPGPDGRPFVIGSLGEDGQQGGTEYNEDIWSHQSRRD